MSKRSKVRASMGRRKVKSTEEQDVHTGWRHVMCSYTRPGAAAKAKRRSRRRERREGKNEARSEW